MQLRFPQVMTVRSKFLLTGCFLALAAQCGYASQRGAHFMKSESLKWGQPLQGCRLSISMSSLRMESGSPIQLTLVFRNDGPFVIKVPRFSLWFDYEFKIRYNELHQISLTPFGQQQKDNSMMSATNVFELAPGQEMT